MDKIATDDEEDELMLYNDDSDADDGTGYRPLEPLPGSQARIYTTKDLHARIHEGLINLNPVWQRAFVWNQKKQSHLIDSLFHNYCIPPVVLALTTTEDDLEEWVCVDGKQRLMSIIEFFAGHIPCRDPRTQKAYYYTTSPQHSDRLQLSAHMKNIFSAKVITCVEYRDLRDDQIRDIFQRVQMGEPLKPAERHQALSTPITTWICQLVEDYVKNDGGISTHITWNVKNAGDFSNVNIAVYCCFNLAKQPTPHRQNIEKWLNTSTMPDRQFKRDIEEMLQTLLDIVSSHKYNKAFQANKISQRVAPVEFVFICVAIYVLNTTRATMEEISNALYRLRTGLRSTVHSIMLNRTACAPLWAYMVLLEGDSSAAFPKNVPAKPQAVRKKAGKKRKAAGSDSEDDYHQPPSPRRHRR